MASELFVDNITGKTGTSGGAPITLSGDTATLSGTGVTFPTGSVIGFNYAISTTEVNGVTADTWVTSGLSVSITPKKDNSKIYVIGTWGVSVNSTEHTGYKVVRTGPSSQDLTIQAFYNSTGWIGGPSSYAAIDTPSSTSECTYTLYLYVDSNTSNYYWNYDAIFTAGGNLMVMEIQQ